MEGDPHKAILPLPGGHHDVDWKASDTYQEHKYYVLSHEAKTKIDILPIIIVKEVQKRRRACNHNMYKS